MLLALRSLVETSGPPAITGTVAVTQGAAITAGIQDLVFNAAIASSQAASSAAASGTNAPPPISTGVVGGWHRPLVLTTTRPNPLAPTPSGPAPIRLAVVAAQRHASIVARGTVDASVFAEDLALLGLNDDEFVLA